MTPDAPRSLLPARPPRAGWRSIVRTAVTDSQPASNSERVAEAQARAQERLHRQRHSLRPLGWAVILVVVIGSANSHPAPGLHGKALAVTLALVVFAAMLLIVFRDGFPERSVELQGAVIAAVGAAGIAIACWARYHLGENWSGTVTLKENHELIRTGPYRNIRHPIYTGILLALLGTAIAVGEARALIAVAIAYASFYTKARREESFPAKEFGANFTEHQRHTGMFLPRLS